MIFLKISIVFTTFNKKYNLEKKSNFPNFILSKSFSALYYYCKQKWLYPLGLSPRLLDNSIRNYYLIVIIKNIIN